MKQEGRINTGLCAYTRALWYKPGGWIVRMLRDCERMTATRRRWWPMVRNHVLFIHINSSWACSDWVCYFSTLKPNHATRVNISIWRKSSNRNNKLICKGWWPIRESNCSLQLNLFLCVASNSCEIIFHAISIAHEFLKCENDNRRKTCLLIWHFRIQTSYLLNCNPFTISSSRRLVVQIFASSMPKLVFLYLV